MELQRQYKIETKLKQRLSEFENRAKNGDKNDKLYLDFYKAICSRENKTVGLARRLLILDRLKPIRKTLYREDDQIYISELTEDQLFEIVNRLENGKLKNGKPKSPVTIRTEKEVLRKVINFCFYGANYAKKVGVEGQSPLSKLVNCRLTKEEKELTSIDEGDILTRKEVRLLIDTAPSVRDKAIISFLAETGCRVGELCGIKFKDLTFNPYNKYEIRVKLFGKTGRRMNNIIYNSRWFLTYLNSNANRGDPSAYVFDILPKVVSLMLKRVATKAGISNYYGKMPNGNMSYGKLVSGKRIYPHIFRHSSVSHKASDGWSEAMIKQWHGWGRSSRMLGNYLHLGSADVMNYNAGKYAQENKPVPEYQQCSCHAMNHKDDLTCWACNTVLSSNQYVDVVEQKNVETRIQDMYNMIAKLAKIQMDKSAFNLTKDEVALWAKQN